MLGKRTEHEGGDSMQDFTFNADSHGGKGSSKAAAKKANNAATKSVKQAAAKSLNKSDAKIGNPPKSDDKSAAADVNMHEVESDSDDEKSTGKDAPHSCNDTSPTDEHAWMVAPPNAVLQDFPMIAHWAPLIVKSL